MLRSFSLKQCKYRGMEIRVLNIKNDKTITIWFVICDLFPFYKQAKLLQYHLVVQSWISCIPSVILPSTAANVSTRYVHNALLNEDIICGITLPFKSLNFTKSRLERALFDILFLYNKASRSYSTDLKVSLSLADPQIFLNSHIKTVDMSKLVSSIRCYLSLSSFLVVWEINFLHFRSPCQDANKNS